MELDQIIKGVSSALQEHEVTVDRRLGDIKREVRNDVTKLLDRDFASDLVKDHRPSKVYGVGALVRSGGGLWQSWAETDLAPGEKDSGWVCLMAGVKSVEFTAPGLRERALHVKMADGTSQTFEWTDPVPLHLGKWDEVKQYSMGDQVAWDGGSWTCVAGETKATPGTSPDWVLSAMRGKIGKTGDQGKQGEQGEQGLPGRDADPVLAAKLLAKGLVNGTMPEAEEIFKTIEDRVSKGFGESGQVEGRLAMYAKGDWVRGQSYSRGDLVTIRGLGLFVAVRGTSVDPRAAGISDWLNILALTSAGGGVTTPPTNIPYVDHITPVVNGQTVFVLNHTPILPATVVMNVNGVDYYQVGDFTFAGSTATWSNLFAITSTDRVVFKYL